MEAPSQNPQVPFQERERRLPSGTSATPSREAPSTSAGPVIALTETEYAPCGQAGSRTPTSQVRYQRE
jgi:hypothetical protein